MLWKDVKLPDGKILIPGVISHQTNVVEHPEVVAWRIKNYASVVGKENVIAGADCGFSQHWDSIRVHPSVQWAKLKALVAGAALASNECGVARNVGKNTKGDHDTRSGGLSTEPPCVSSNVRVADEDVCHAASRLPHDGRLAFSRARCSHWLLV